MMRHILSFLLGISLFVTFSLPQAYAGGFYLQEQSSSAMGSAFAGASAMPRDASILYYNPAGMTELEGAQMSVGMDVLKANANLKDNGSTLLGAPVAGVDSDDPTPVSYLPNMYVAVPIHERIVWLGLALSVPFGLSTKYDEDWIGRYDAIKSELLTVDVQPSIAIKFSDWLSVGGGVNFQYVDAELTKAVTNGVTEGLSKLEGNDWSGGYNIGVLFQPWDGTALGFHYRSRVYHTLDGRITVTGVAGLNESTGGKADLDLPEIVSSALAQRLSDNWTLLAQFNWFGWDSFKDITAIRDNGTIASSTLQNYQSSWSASIGTEHEWSDDLTLRFGYEYDTTPSTIEGRSAGIPDSDRHMIAGGFTLDMTDKMALNMSALYAQLDDTQIDVSRNANLARVRLERDDASFAFISLGVDYKF